MVLPTCGNSEWFSTLQHVNWTMFEIMNQVRHYPPSHVFMYMSVYVYVYVYVWSNDYIYALRIVGSLHNDLL